MLFFTHATPEDRSDLSDHCSVFTWRSVEEEGDGGYELNFMGFFKKYTTCKGLVPPPIRNSWSASGMYVQLKRSWGLKKFIWFQKFQNQNLFQDIQNYFDPLPPPPNVLFPKKLTKMTSVWSHSLQEECIPVGSVPSAAVAIGGKGFCPGGVSSWGGVCLPGGVHLPPPPTVDRFLHLLWKHNLSATTVADGKYKITESQG